MPRFVTSVCIALLSMALGCPGPTHDDDVSGDDDASADDDTGDDDTGDDDTGDDDTGDDDTGDDDTGDDDTGDDDCPYSDPPDPIGDSPLPGDSPAGASETTTVDGYTDEYLYDGTGYLKIGVRREWGGTVIFFGQADGFMGMNGTNVIDANDTGREVQVAFYDPDRRMQNCAWNASCQSNASDCPESITYLGWNPVQGGNRCNHGSGVDSVTNGGGVLEVETTPLFWNPNWDFQDCDSGGCDDPSLEYRVSDVTVRQTMRFVRTHVVEIRYEVQETGGLDHAVTGQEMPTVYTANGNNGPDLWRLFDSAGTEIAIDTPGNDGFFYENFSSPEPWVTMQDDYLSYGVGILHENNITDFQGWQQRDLPFNNVRAQFPFGIPAHGTVRARAYLILGSQVTVADEASWVMDNLAPFGHLDEPGDSVEPSTEVTIRGWALDNRSVSSIEAVIDESVHVPLTYGTSRPDVDAVWPKYPGDDLVGFTGTHDFGPADECPHLIEIVATDSDGNSRTIWNSLVTVEN